MLPFQRALAGQLDRDSLLILARGLGLRAIVTASVRCFDRSDCLVLVVNATSEDERGMNEEMGMRMRCLGHEMPSKEREKVYKEGGVVSATSRILIVDLLNKKMDLTKITGLVVLHAELVTPTSVEAFIVRVFKAANKTGFIKAFSDEPEQFTFGVSPLQTVLTQLKIRDVSIWPRFHSDVKRDLEQRRADVVELHQPLSPAMDEIQTATIECMEATLAEIRRGNPGLEMDDMTVESALFRSFDVALRSQLNPTWHRVSPKTKQLISDLTTLRKLLSYLISFDCVSFHRFLEAVLEANADHGGGVQRQHRSPWLFMDAASTIFTVAKKRVYVRRVAAEPGPPAAGPEEDGPTEDEEEALRQAEEEAEREAHEAALRAARAAGYDVSGFELHTSSASASASVKPKDDDSDLSWLPPSISPVLEEQPKWALLRDVLDEIEDQLWRDPAKPASPMNDTVLVMCGSATTCATLKEYLIEREEPSQRRGDRAVSGTEGKGGLMMRRRLRQYFWWKRALGKMARKLKSGSDGNQASAVQRGADGKKSGSGVGRGGAGGGLELSAALKRKAEWRKGQPPAGKRRRVRGGGPLGSGGGRVGERDAKALDTVQLEKEAGEVADLIDAREAAPSFMLPADAMTHDFDEAEFDEYFGLLQLQDLVVVRPYTGDEDDRVLEELRPRYVVMYDPDPAFIRRIECYRAAHKGLAVRVYFLMYLNSVEEQKYLSSIRKEKESFERLIKENSVMVVPLEAEARLEDASQEELLRTVHSRIAGGGKVAQTGPPRVIVDMREFRSSLPSLLHRASFEVVPLTLVVGDYVLSKDMCVERKSIADLIQSFNSGRLYQQCEVMSIHYKTPILLIEFDLKKSFSLETYTETKGGQGPNTSDTDLQAKLVLLTISFPRLRIIWSSSPYQTADIFSELKQNHAEPDPESAALVGMEESAEPTSAAVAAVEGGFSTAAQDLLRSLPGITSKNCRYVTSQARNMEELCQLEAKELQDIIGSEPGAALHAFLNESVSDGAA